MKQVHEELKKHLEYLSGIKKETEYDVLEIIELAQSCVRGAMGISSKDSFHNDYEKLVKIKKSIMDHRSENEQMATGN